jgi:hypothetical protein
VRKRPGLYFLWGSSTEKDEPPVSELPVIRKHLRSDRTQLKKPEQSKQKNKSEQVRSQRAQHRSAKLPVRLIEAAGDRRKSAIETVDVVTPRTDLEEWQRALYEEFLVWRTRQLMFHDPD